MDVAGAERELAGLRRAVSRTDEHAGWACKLNLVVACADAADAERVTPLIARISESEPGRALVIAPTGRAETRGLSLSVTTHCHGGEGDDRICCEQVTLEAGEQDLPLVPGTILRLLVGDMPVYTWWRRNRLAGDPLLKPLRDLSNRLIVNSASFDDPTRGLKQLLAADTEDSWKGRSADLAWARLDPWREAVASFFDAPALGERLPTITAVIVRAGGPASRSGLTAAGAYMAGWLSSRLGWTPMRGGHWCRRDGGAVRLELQQLPDLTAGDVGSIRIESASGEAPIAFAVERMAPDSEVVRLTVAAEAACPLPRMIKLPVRDEAALLCGTLQVAGREPTFEAALVDAAQMA